jgi:small subunit ribosomal protein S8
LFIKDDIIEFIRIFLKYDYQGKPVITRINRVSKPGYRVYVVCSKIPRVLDGLGISILSTSKGVVSDKVAKKLGIGGEVICNVW